MRPAHTPSMDTYLPWTNPTPLQAPHPGVWGVPKPNRAYGVIYDIL